MKHSLFTLLLGIWSPTGLVTAPFFLILNTRGGMDITGDFSTTSIDPGQGERDLKTAQWTFVGLAMIVLIAALWSFLRHG